MRGLFVVLLKLSGWLSPLVGLLYAIGAAKALDVPAPIAGFLGLLVGLAGLVFWLGVAEVVEVIFAGEGRAEEQGAAQEVKALGQRLLAIEKRLESLDDVTTLKQLSDANGKLDDLHEGLSDVMEESLGRLDAIMAKVGASLPPKEDTGGTEAPGAPKLDLSAIPEAKR